MMASHMKATELRKILTLAEVQIPAKSKHVDLWRLCLENKLVEREIVEQTEITIVKTSLQCAMTLDTQEYELFLKRIEEYVFIVSRLLRRSSLIFYFHVLRLNEEDKPIPDLYKMKDTYWKHWLTIGLQKDYPDKDSKTSYTLSQGLFDEPTLSKEIENLKFFDQILCYAAHTFKTAIENNSWYPLFDKLTRLSKLKLNEWNITDVGKHTVVQQIRNPIDKLDDSLPLHVLEFVKEVKAGLVSCDNEEYIGDKHAKENMTFHQAFKFNMWMQKHFNTLEARMTKLAPVFAVSRAHIRLDTKTLTFLFKDMFPENDAVKRYDAFVKSTGCVALLPEPLIVLKEKDCTAEQWIEFKKTRTIYKEKVKHIKASPEYQEIAKQTSKAPHKKLLPSKPAILKKKGCSKEEWEAYQAKLKQYKVDTENVKKTNELYIAQEALYKKHEDEQIRMVSSFFKKLRKKKYRFDCSVQTDGVSISRQYSKVISVEKKPPLKLPEPTIVDEYNKNLSCFINAINTLVIGLDPGRVNLACLSYIWIKDDGTVEKKSWSLSRAQYYNDSGIKARGIKKASRFESLIDSWSKLGTLKAVASVDVINYVKQYNDVKNKWWRLAFNKKEARSKLCNYSGKKKVLDKFFSKVKKEVKALHPDVNIIVAYGSAFNGMSPSGRGEMSAPVGQVYKTCCKYLETQIENEDCSTKTSFETGQVMEKVYKRFYKKGDKVFEEFGHCDQKVVPIAVEKNDRDLLDAFNAQKKKKTRWKKPGEENVKEKDKRRFNFPVIRGLQFCPETCKYVDRDVKASLTIGRLAVMRISGNTRPKAFVKEKKIAVRKVVDVEEAQSSSNTLSEI